MTYLKECALNFRARRAAYKAGFLAIKSRSRDGYANQGGYKLIEPSSNLPVAGSRYDLTAEDVIEYLRRSIG
jgi:hypothetical protein